MPTPKSPRPSVRERRLKGEADSDKLGPAELPAGVHLGVSAPLHPQLRSGIEQGKKASLLDADGNLKPPAEESPAFLDISITAEAKRQLEALREEARELGLPHETHHLVTTLLEALADEGVRARVLNTLREKYSLSAERTGPAKPE